MLLFSDQAPVTTKMDARSAEARFLLEDAHFEDLLGALNTDEALEESSAIHTCAAHGHLMKNGGAMTRNAWHVSLGDGDNSTPFLGAAESTSQALSSGTCGRACPRSKKPSVNSTRERMKEELAYLRVKVVELEQQLHELTEKAAVKGAISVPSDGENGDIAALMNMQSSLWERVARHQRVEKQKAERRNAELRELLEEQLTIARSLEKALKKRPSAMLSRGLQEELETSLASRSRICEVQDTDDTTFARLAARADASFCELEAVWRRTGLGETRAERNDTQVMVDHSNGLYLEVINAKIVPFSLRATTEAAWTCLSQPNLKFLNGIYRRTRTTGDSIHSKSDMWIRFGESEARMELAIVTKRFIQKNRVVFVLESSSVSGGPRDVLSSVKIVEKGWVVFEQVDALSSESTLIQVCIRLMPALTESSTANHEASCAGMITDIILAAFHQNLGLLYQTVENMLVEQMISKEIVSPSDNSVEKTIVTKDVIV